MMRPAAESESLHYIGPPPPPREFGRRCLSIKRNSTFCTHSGTAAKKRPNLCRGLLGVAIFEEDDQICPSAKQNGAISRQRELLPILPPL